VKAGIVVALVGLVAVAAGGPLTALVLRLVDRGMKPADHRLEEAGHLLRGGAWIGALERTAIYATLVAGWPGGLAVALALKSFGRYPELKTRQAGTAERFIIGTFTSVLWAAGCAGVAVALR